MFFRIIKVLTVCALTSAACSATSFAQTPVPAKGRVAEAMDMTMPGVSLASLLNNGWFIQTIGGSEGEVMILYKGDGTGKNNKYERCVLSSNKGPNMTVNQPGLLDVSCRSLN